MSRATVYELLARDDPSAYVAKPMPSLLDPFKNEVRAMLAANPRACHGGARAVAPIGLHPEAAGLCGQLAAAGVTVPVRTPEFKGQVEGAIHYLEHSFLPLREFTSLADLQAQHDGWAAETVWRRRLARDGACAPPHLCQ